MSPDPLPHLGAGVALRRLNASDLNAFQACRTDADLGCHQGWSPMPEAAALAFLEEMNAVPRRVAHRVRVCRAAQSRPTPTLERITP